MKARVKATGANVDVYCDDMKVSDDTIFYEYVNSNSYKRRELFFEQWDEKDTFTSTGIIVDWGQRKYELAKAAMQGMCTNFDLNTNNSTYDCKLIAKLAIKQANEMIEQLKEIEAKNA
jgi:hypothetical protein